MGGHMIRPNQLSFGLLISLFLTLPMLGHAENLRQGCRSIGDCGTNTHNRFNDGYMNRSKFQSQGACNKRLRCPRDMEPVCSEEYATRVCMDRDLAEDNQGYPLGNFNYYQCRDYCRSRGLRLPTNNEWLVASIGTEKQLCLPTHRPARPDWNSRRQMSDQSFNQRGVRRDLSQCESDFGVRDMVGVLGQWVTKGQATRSDREQFNGGLWPQPASNIFYRTTPHGPGYSDYSIGCRCARDAN